MDETRMHFRAATNVCGDDRRFGSLRSIRVALAWFLILGSVVATRAEIQFDVFFGFNQATPEASWFPVACEVFNDEAPFRGTFEIAPGSYSDARRMTVELPTGTRKRFVVPVFSSGRYYGDWNARLLDERGKVRAELPGIRGKNLHSQLPLMGALTGLNPPQFPELELENRRPPELDLWVARLQAATFPDHPIALQGLRSLYLSSSKALENSLNPDQVRALLAWIHNGGHLILSVEQTLHINGTDWLKQLIPCVVTEKAEVKDHSALHRWVASAGRCDGTRHRFSDQSRQSPFAGLKEDGSFEGQPMEVAQTRLRDGIALVEAASQPLVVTAARGRGRVTVLLFDPEKEPFRSWKNRSYFWAKMADLPPALLLDRQIDHYTSYSIDGVIGAMIDSKQIRKLPVGWLLLLLVAYLAVIGPIDRFWLKKINRQMLTWITFPCYVALFSGLIYFIGYNLRAGETEWNELHLVDVLPVGSQADLRGWTYVSVYSPVNATYAVSSDQPYATFRGELRGMSNVEGSQTQVQQRAGSFDATVSVPVWTSQLFMSDWLRRDSNPLGCRVSRSGSGFQVALTNGLGQALGQVKLVVEDKVFDLDPVEVGGIVSARTTGVFRPLENYIKQTAGLFHQAHDSRQRAFGQDTGQLLMNVAESSMAASFISKLESNPNQNFLTPPGLDLSPLLEQNHAIVLVWAEDYGPTKPLNDFVVRRNQRNTLFRIVVPLQ